MTTLPTLHLDEFTRGTPDQRTRFVRAFGDSFREYGFAVIDGHGVPPALIDGAFAHAARLFALPLPAKRAFLRPDIGRARGYTEFGRERAVGADAHDLKEFWHVGQEVEAAEGHAYPPNVWPAEALVPGFRADLVALYRAFEARALVLLRAVALYLDLPEEHFAEMARGGNSVLRLIHYPPVEGEVPAGAVRAAAHEDINLITLLCEGTSGGLELLRPDGSWLPVTSLGGQLVINAGDMLTRCANGLIPATTHRVKNPDDPGQPRYSIPFFTHPRPEVVLAPASTTVSPARPAAHAPVRAYDFLVERLRENGVFDADPLSTI